MVKSEPLPRGREELRDRAGEIEDSGLFGEVEVREYRWDASYDAESYVRLLGTYSGHASLEERARERLFRGMAEMIDTRFGGRVMRANLTTLYAARRK
jgi:hypothetical protein